MDISILLSSRDNLSSASQGLKGSSLTGLSVITTGITGDGGRDDDSVFGTDDEDSSLMLSSSRHVWDPSPPRISPLEGLATGSEGGDEDSTWLETGEVIRSEASKGLGFVTAACEVELD